MLNFERYRKPKEPSDLAGKYRGMRVEENVDAPNFRGVVWCDVQ